MRRIVLIDGENLVHGLQELLSVDGVTLERSALKGFNYRGMIEEILADNPPLRYFGLALSFVSMLSLRR